MFFWVLIRNVGSPVRVFRIPLKNASVVNKVPATDGNRASSLKLILKLDIEFFDEDGGIFQCC